MPTRAMTEPGGRAALRREIQGLRAIAVALVLVFHAWPSVLPGGFVGVDVFFVISGFLITGLLIRELERSGRISLREFYARRAKRLLPAAGLVLVVTAILTWLTAPVTSWRTFGGDIVGAATYVLDAVVKGAFTVPGDGSLDFEAIVKRLASYGYEGWFVVEAEQDPKANPPIEMARIGHKELARVMAAAGYTVEA